ncbi:MAG: hypothetical protein II794_01725 [Oscillospiraceae bacterium]|nr:hypothetical protein [Oscillospiraceae bacterium]
MKKDMSPGAFYALSLTWGCITTLGGALVALALLITGHRPKKWGYAWCFEAGRGWGGFSMGPFLVTCRDGGQRLRDHEFGHSIQNCRFGPLMPFLVSIPSSTRYRWRLFRERVLKKPSATPYDSVWFEAQATRLGTEFMTRFREKEME